MKGFIYFSVLFLILHGCGNKPDSRVKKTEQSISSQLADLKKFKLSDTRTSLLERALAALKKFETTNAPSCCSILSKSEKHGWILTVVWIAERPDADSCELSIGGMNVKLQASPAQIHQNTTTSADYVQYGFQFVFDDADLIKICDRALADPASRENFKYQISVISNGKTIGSSASTGVYHEPSISP